jgi:hypothetical protein
MIQITGSALAKTRMNLALHHLFAASRFAANVVRIERLNSGQAFGPFWEEILHNSLGVATLTVAALESYANEMYFEGSVLNGKVTSAAAEEIGQLVDRESILRKYSVALSVQTGRRMDYGKKEVQNVDALVRIRNGVVHFRPEWFGDQAEHEKLSRKLQHKFQPSQFLANEPLFPRSWASGSFSLWAVNSVIEFLKYYFSEIGQESPIAHFEVRIAELLNAT